MPANRRNRNDPKSGATERGRGSAPFEPAGATGKRPAKNPANRQTAGAAPNTAAGPKRHKSAGPSSGSSADARAVARRGPAAANADARPARNAAAGPRAQARVHGAAHEPGATSTARPHRTRKTRRAKTAYRPETPHQARKAPKSRVSEAKVPHRDRRRAAGGDPGRTAGVDPKRTAGSSQGRAADSVQGREHNATPSNHRAQGGNPSRGRNAADGGRAQSGGANRREDAGPYGVAPRPAVYSGPQDAEPQDNMDFGPERKPHYDRDGLHVPTGTGEVTFTRRQLLIGAGVAAGLVAVGGIASAYQNSQRNAASFDTLTVPNDQVITLDGFSQVKAKGRISRLGSYQLPYGTLMWCNSSKVAVCLLPTSKAKPLVTMALFSLADGSTATVLRRAKGQSEGFGVYDARCSDAGAVWVEENILTGAWRIYTAPLDGLSLGSATKVDEGDSSTETPTIAAVDDNAFWQVMPPAPTDDSGTVDGQSAVRTAPFAAPSQVRTVFTCDGRMDTPVSAGDGGVVITPPHEGAGSYCQLTLINAAGQVLDALTLPSGMTPQNVGYGPTGFTFAFPDIYDYGDGISQLGTYAPLAKPADGNYSGQTWFRFGRTPTQAACWCGPRLMVKSSRAVAGINLTDRTYFTLSLENGAQDYGDCLASAGAHKKLVTFQNVDNTEARETGAASSTGQAKYCLVRVWQVRS